MKNLKFISLLAFIAAVMCSCGNKDVTNLVKEFATASQAKDSVKMAELYPDSKIFAMKTLAAENLDISVESVDGKEDTYKAMCNDSIEFIVKKAGEKYQIESSRGLLVLPKDLTFAKGTGQYKEELSDAENYKRLNDKAFIQWVLKDVAKDLDSKVKVVRSDYEIVSRHATDYAGGEVIIEKYTAEIKITVQNELDIEINADAYNVVSSVYVVAYFNEPAKCQKTTNPESKTIAPHSTMVLTYTFSGEGDYVEGMGWIDHIKSVLSLNMLNLDVSKFYTPKGGEYDEYLKTHSGSSNGLTLHMLGKLGGDAASNFTLDGEEGTYSFVGGSRTTKLAEYDKATGELIIDAYLNGKRIGFFKGTYANGTYKGTFTNSKNGARLSFDFHE